MKKHFKIKKLEKWDYYTLIIYSLLTLFILLLKDTNIVSTKLVTYYSISTNTFLLFFNYKSLQKINVWTIWFIISLFHIYLADILAENDKFQTGLSVAYLPLKSNWLFLIAFQISRIYILKTKHREFLMPVAIPLSGTTRDLWSNKRPELIDKSIFTLLLFFILYLLIYPPF